MSGFKYFPNNKITATLCLFIFLGFTTRILSQNLCKKDLVVWLFSIENNERKTAETLENEVEQTLVALDRMRVYERRNYLVLSEFLENERNLSVVQDGMSPPQTINQLQGLSVDVVVTGHVEKDFYNNEVILRLDFYNIKTSGKNAMVTIIFKNNEFNNSTDRQNKIFSFLNDAIVCNELSEKISLLENEIFDLETEYKRIMAVLQEKYEERNVLDEMLGNAGKKGSKKIVNDILKLHEKICELKAEEEKCEKDLGDKRIELEKLRQIQIENPPPPPPKFPPEPKTPTYCIETKFFDCLPEELIQQCFYDFQMEYRGQWFVQAAALPETYEPCRLSPLYSYGSGSYSYKVFLIDNTGNSKRYNDKAVFEVRLGPFPSPEVASYILEKVKTHRDYRTAETFFVK